MEIFTKEKSGGTNTLVRRYFDKASGRWQVVKTQHAVQGDISSVYSAQSGGMEAFYRGDDGHLHRYYNDNGTWKTENLSASNEAPVAANSVISAVYEIQRNHTASRINAACNFGNGL